MQDKRRKLSDEQKEEIKKIKLKTGRFNGASDIAKEYGVSKRTIQFLLAPEKLEKNRELSKNRKKKILKFQQRK